MKPVVVFVDIVAVNEAIDRAIVATERYADKPDIVRESFFLTFFFFS